MLEFDVVIVGAGLAGAMCASVLARRGHHVAIVDPNEVYPADFRCEKLDGVKMEVLKNAGLDVPVRAAATFDRRAWVTRLGRLVEKKPGDQHGIDYSHLVNTLRDEIPSDVAFVRGKATAISNTADRQIVHVSSGEKLSARLVILATGLNNALRQSLGMEREDLSPCHSVSFGFDLEPAEGSGFPFCALTHYGEHPRSKIAYLTLFPIGDKMRANLFVHHALDDPWLRAFREAPESTLKAAMPRLQRFTGDFRIVGPLKVRPMDLYVTCGYRQPGIILIGDAFGTACPGAGTGATKALIDAERLCNGYVSRWLASPGMGVEKISEFYDDPAKRKSDRHSLALAWSARSMATDESAFWWAMRCGAAVLGLARWAVHSVTEIGRNLSLSRHPRAAEDGIPSSARPTGLVRLVELSHRLRGPADGSAHLEYFGYDDLLKGSAPSGMQSGAEAQARGAAGQTWNTPAEALPIASTTAMLSNPGSRPCMACNNAASPSAPIGIGGS